MVEPAGAVVAMLCGDVAVDPAGAAIAAPCDDAAATPWLGPAPPAR
jgi:hypothetical protein